MPFEWWVLFTFFALVVWAIFVLGVWMAFGMVVRFFARRAENRAAGRLHDLADRYRVGL